MIKKNLSKLNTVELREVWEHEALDFTQWLSEDDNLMLLSNEIGIPIKIIKPEAEVGKFKVDILAKEESSNRKIIIENQLEYTDHDHLGKIITYASGYDAEIIIWIVSDVREEHQKAIEWLNDHTDEEINFFLIKLELWQIDGSNPAPKFDIIVSPNEWFKAIKTTIGSGELTETRLQQLDFWTKFRDFAQEIDKTIRLRKPFPENWYGISMGTSVCTIGLSLNSQENTISCYLYINRDKNFFNFLKERKEQIEKQIGGIPEWRDASKASIIILKEEVKDIFDQNEAENYFKWLYEKAILFQKVFIPFIKEYKKFQKINQDET